MTGIKDVARELEMSTATVSRALRGLPGVSDETRQMSQASVSSTVLLSLTHPIALTGGLTLL